MPQSKSPRSRSRSPSPRAEASSIKTSKSTRSAVSPKSGEKSFSQRSSRSPSPAARESPSTPPSPSRSLKGKGRAATSESPNSGSGSPRRFVGAAEVSPTSATEEQIEQLECSPGTLSASDLSTVPSQHFPSEANRDAASSKSLQGGRDESGETSLESEPEEIEITINDGDGQTSLSIPQPLLLTSTIARGAYHQCGTARRVKVYELSNETWQDRGTGYCAGVYDEGHDEALLVARMENECLKIEGALPDPRRQLAKVDPLMSIGMEPDVAPTDSGPQPYYLIVSPQLDVDEILLKTRVVKEDVYQKQQETLVVWTEPDGTDMALSFQEAEGCHEVWEFIVEVQKHFHLNSSIPTDVVSDPPTPDPGSPQSGELSASAFGIGGLASMDATSFALPEPNLGNLDEVEAILKNGAQKGPGAREKMAEWVARADYIRKLCPVFHDAEDLENLESLHFLCSIMQSIIMLNDSGIIEAVLADDVFLTVVGIFEYDPEYPVLKASYRDYFQNTARFKHVVDIEDPKVVTKIHQAYRLQYLKDVILVRILDDAMFSVLNSWIFFHQYDIVNYCTVHETLLTSIYQICAPNSTATVERKHDAIFFLQHLCAIGKQIQLPSRIALYRTLAETGLLPVLESAVFEEDQKVQNAAAEMLMIIIEYDPNSVRNHVLEQVEQKKKTLISIMSDLLQNVDDLGLKSQIAESLKTLFDNGSESGPPNASLAAAAAAARTQGDPEQFLHWFYESDVEHLFAPLKQLPKVTSLAEDARLDLSPRPKSALLGHLCDLLCYAVLQHTFRSQYFVITSQIATHVGSLLFAKEKHIRLAAIRFFRACIGSNNQFTNRHFIKVGIFGALMNLIERESARDNLVLSACLDLFEHMRKENMRPLVEHISRDFDKKLHALAEKRFTAKCFSALLEASEASTSGSVTMQPVSSTTLQQTEAATSQQHETNEERQRRQRDMVSRGLDTSGLDMEEDDYFNDVADEEEPSSESGLPFAREGTKAGGMRKRKRNSPSGRRSLVPYEDLDDSSDSDREDDSHKTEQQQQQQQQQQPRDVDDIDPLLQNASSSTIFGREKRRRGEADEAELKGDHDENSELFVRLAKRKASENSGGDEDEGGFLRTPLSESGAAASEQDGTPLTPRTASGVSTKKSLNLSATAQKAVVAAAAGRDSALGVKRTQSGSEHE